MKSLGVLCVPTEIVANIWPNPQLSSKHLDNALGTESAPRYPTNPPSIK